MVKQSNEENKIDINYIANSSESGELYQNDVDNE